MNIVLQYNTDVILLRFLKMHIGINFVDILGFAINRKDAFNTINEKKPELAIVDIKMPKINVLKEGRRTNENQRFIRLIFLYWIKIKKAAFDSGVNCFLSKSNDFDKNEDIISKIRS